MAAKKTVEKTAQAKAEPTKKQASLADAEASVETAKPKTTKTKTQHWINKTHIPGYGTVQGEVTPEALEAFKEVIPNETKLENWIK